MPTIGLIANPVSARDIRRIVANASNLQIADRVNIVLRVLTAAHSLGVERVLVMPDNGGIRALLQRHLSRGHSQHQRWPVVEYLDMEPTSTVEDTFQAARLMRAAGVAAIVVLGGDGTHRAVVRECRDIPIAGLSTGTNNAFPEMRESTITGMAVALYATGRLSAAQALAPNKLLEVSINDGRAARHRAGRRRDLDRPLHRRARAVEARVAERGVPDLRRPAGDRPVGHRRPAAAGGPARPRRPGGALGHHPHPAALRLLAPIAPGMVRPVSIAHWQAMPADQPFAVPQQGGVVALDGERELAFDAGDRVQITLRENAFPTVDVARCMHIAACDGLLRLPSTP